MNYGIDMQLRDLLDSPAACEIFDRHLPGIRRMAQNNPQSGSLTLRTLVGYLNRPQFTDALPALDADLQQLNTAENRISPKEAALIRQFQLWEQADRQAPPAPEAHRQDAICPGQVWLDTQGSPIQAHGGAVFYEDGTYYWYGEDKHHTDGENGVWTWGIRMYASEDLLNWRNLGLIIPPDLQNPDSSLFPTRRVDRPHILHCPATGRYVCWIKLSGGDAAFTILQADRLQGPYSIVREFYRPEGVAVGDFDLIADAQTGTGYLYYNAHAGEQAIVCLQLAEDYCSTGPALTRQYAGLHPPFTREGPALFREGGSCYMFTSGMTGYLPNRSDVAAAPGWDAPFVSLGDPHVADATHASFNSQITKVFRVESTGQWIAMADRWVPDYPVDAAQADLIERVVASRYDPAHYQADAAEQRSFSAAPTLDTACTSRATYVWLPVEWDASGRPQLRWQDAWTPAV